MKDMRHSDMAAHFTRPTALLGDSVRGSDPLPFRKGWDTFTHRKFFIKEKVSGGGGGLSLKERKDRRKTSYGGRSTQKSISITKVQTFLAKMLKKFSFSLSSKK